MNMSSNGLLIGDNWQQGDGGVMTSISPVDGTEIWQGNEASAKQVDEAVLAAKNAFPAWSKTTIDERIKILEGFSKKLDENKQEIATLIARETGKALWDALGEVGAGIAKLAISIKAYNDRTGLTVGENGAIRTRLQHRPHGVMAIFGPYNFPLHLPNGHMVPALLAGNTIVYKPSDLTPMVAEYVVDLWGQAGLPNGVLNLVQGGATVGQALVANEKINGVLFTGSVPTGKAIAKALAGRIDVITALELGGNNPLVLGQVSDLEAAAIVTVQSAFISSGQRCTCARRIMVPTGSYGDQFIATLSKLMADIKTGNPLADEQPFMGPVVSEKAAAAVMAYQQGLVDSGASIIVPAEMLADGAAYVSPGLIDVTAIAQKPDDECFGPLLQVVRCESLEIAIDEANNTRFGLAAGLLSDERQEYEQFITNIRAGIVNWNKPLTGASSAAPFGGIGDSGNHRPSAYYAADYCAYAMASMEDASDKLSPQAMPQGIKTKGTGK